MVLLSSALQQAAGTSLPWPTWAKAQKVERVLGPIDYFLWFASALLEAWVVVCAIRARSLSKYFTLNAYMGAAFMFNVGRFVVFFRSGYASPQYTYFYWFSDALLTIFLYFALMGLYAHVFQEMGAHRYVRLAALVLLAGTAWFSYEVVVSSSDRLLTRFVVELSQNLYFVGVVLTYVLWGAIMKLRETRTRLIQLVLALGVYFSAFAANYALRNLYPDRMIWHHVPPVLGILLPVAWAHSFRKIPEEARLATARVATPNR